MSEQLLRDAAIRSQQQRIKRQAVEEATRPIQALENRIARLEAAVFGAKTKAKARKRP